MNAPLKLQVCEVVEMKGNRRNRQTRSYSDWLVGCGLGTDSWTDWNLRKEFEALTEDGCDCDSITHISDFILLIRKRLNGPPQLLHLILLT